MTEADDLSSFNPIAVWIVYWLLGMVAWVYEWPLTKKDLEDDRKKWKRAYNFVASAMTLGFVFMLLLQWFFLQLPTSYFTRSEEKRMVVVSWPAGAFLGFLCSADYTVLSYVWSISITWFLLIWVQPLMPDSWNPGMAWATSSGIVIGAILFFLLGCYLLFKTVHVCFKMEPFKLFVIEANRWISTSVTVVMAANFTFNGPADWWNAGKARQTLLLGFVAGLTLGKMLYHYFLFPFLKGFVKGARKASSKKQKLDNVPPAFASTPPTKPPSKPKPLPPSPPPPTIPTQAAHRPSLPTRTPGSRGFYYPHEEDVGDDWTENAPLLSPRYFKH